MDAAAFTFRWQHPDPRMDWLYEQASARVELGAQCGEPPERTYAAIQALAYGLASRPLPTASAASGRRPKPPRLSEDWFC